MSRKKYIVELTDSECEICKEVIGKLKGTSQKVRRAQILLKADSGWPDSQIADAFSCRTKTVENIRQRFVEFGFEQTLNRKKSAIAGAQKLLDGSEEAKIIAMRLGSPLVGYGKWTLRLLARKVVELKIAETISYETIRQTLKKSHEYQAGHRVLGHPPPKPTRNSLRTWKTYWQPMKKRTILRSPLFAWTNSRCS